MTHNLRFPSAPRHDAETDFLDALGPAWSAMTPQQRRGYAHPDVIATEDDVAARGTGSITLSDVAELLDVALRFPGTVRREGLRYVAERWCATAGAVTLATVLQTAPDDLLAACVLPFPTPTTAPRARALRVG